MMELTTAKPAETTRLIGQEWVTPKSYWTCDNVPYAGVIGVKTSGGWILLANVYQVMSGEREGHVFRTLANYDELSSDYE